MNQLENKITTLKNNLSFNTNFEFKDLEFEKESHEYNACRFSLNDLKVICRTAKITPTKTGQFVTIWKRIGNKGIQHFHISDEFDFIIIITKNKTKYGYFLFPKKVLAKQGVVSTYQKEGKRGFRIYPSWDEPSSKQAQETQNWQLNYFFTLSSFDNESTERIKKLFFKE